MIKEFIFTIGLPGCGKTTYLEKHYNNVFDYAEWNKFFMYHQENEPKFGEYCQTLISSTSMEELPAVIQIAADDLKPFLKGYSDEHPETVHEDSVQLSRKLVFELADSKIFNGIVVMDGGAINNRYTSDIIEYLKVSCQDIKITGIFFDIPVNICVERILQRQRKVPIDSIYDKNLMITSCVNRYKDMVDNFIRVDYFTNKYLLLDMDGTIAAYGKVKKDKDGNSDFVNSELFLHLRPVQYVIDFIKANYNMKNVYIVTACPNSISWSEKCIWLDKYFPEIPKENRYFCGNKDYKDVFVKQLAIKNGWKLNEITLIDDYHKTIDDCMKRNINCLHPSNIDALTDKFAILSR